MINDSHVPGADAGGLDFSVVLPYFNELDFIADTLQAWQRQRQLPREIILVDNGSTDGSAGFVRKLLNNEQRFETIFLSEPRPGKVYALQTGIARARCAYIALSDADTYYPPHYIELSAHLFAAHDAFLSAVMALPEPADARSRRSRLRRRGLVLFQKLWPKHTFAGGHGQLFRRSALESVGGFSDVYWSYVLLDHEIMYRVLSHGRACYHRELWCRPSNRRKDRTRVRWTFAERMLYLAVPHRFQGWFFYRFLKNRFDSRGLSQLRLREKPWTTQATRNAPYAPVDKSQ